MGLEYYNEMTILVCSQCCIMRSMTTNERIDHLERLLEVVRGLTTAPDLESFLQTIINEAIELTNSELASILEYDETAEELRFLAMHWFQRDLLRPDGRPVGWKRRRLGLSPGSAADHSGRESGSASFQSG